MLHHLKVSNDSYNGPGERKTRSLEKKQPIFPTEALFSRGNYIY